MGCVGRDKYSKILEDKATTDGLNVRYQYTDKEGTGTCAVLITGKDRSLCANLAAANCFSPSHIEKPENKQLIETAKYIYISVSALRHSNQLYLDQLYEQCDCITFYALRSKDNDRSCNFLDRDSS